MDEQRRRFIEDFQWNYYTITELAERLSISPTPSRRPIGTTAHKWISDTRRKASAGSRSDRAGRKAVRCKRCHFTGDNAQALNGQSAQPRIDSLLAEMYSLRSHQTRNGEAMSRSIMDIREIVRRMRAVQTNATIHSEVGFSKQSLTR